MTTSQIKCLIENLLETEKEKLGIYSDLNEIDEDGVMDYTNGKIDALQEILDNIREYELDE